MNYNFSNENNEDNNLNQSILETKSSFYRYKCHFICFIIWIVVISIMIGYYYLR